VVDVKGRAATVIAVIVLALSALGATAASGATIETSPVSFVITSDTCSNLPPGTTVTGSGTQKSVTTTLDRDGLTTIINSTHARGTATDQDGNTYVWSYSNSFRATDSAGDPGVFTGRMADHFSLSGSGPATLNNGFIATITTDFTTFFTGEPINAHGDPLDFSDFSAHCDPL
jgi:hypothetical protein